MKEQREAFDHLLQLGEDYQAAKLAFSAAQREAEAIRDAVAERIQADITQTDKRVVELERLVRDKSRPVSARKVWELELSQLQARTFGATPDEVTEFDAKMMAAQEAVADFGRLQREIRGAISSVETEIKKMRAQTLGDPATGLWENRLDSVRKSFKPLCQEVGA